MISAFAFLTVLPVRTRTLGAPTPMLLAFPLVGLSIGAAWSATAWAAGPVLPAAAVAGLVLLVDLVLTGALHLDAVGDVGDGFAARRAGGDPAAAMRDPRIGSVGAATVATVLLVRFGALLAFVSEPWLLALWLAPVLGRVGMVVALWASPAREGSLASPLIDAARWWVAAATLVLGAAAGGAAIAAGSAGGPVLAAVVAAPVVAVALTRLGVRAFGRSSGDLVGAAGVAAETSALLALLWIG